MSYNRIILGLESRAWTHLLRLDPSPIPWKARSCFWQLLSAWICATSRGSADLSKPIGAAAAPTWDKTLLTWGKCSSSSLQPRAGHSDSKRNLSGEEEILLGCCPGSSFWLLLMSMKDETILINLFRSCIVEDNAEEIGIIWIFKM